MTTEEMAVLNQVSQEAAYKATELLMNAVNDYVEVPDENPHDFGGWAALYASEIESRLEDFVTEAVVDWRKWVESCEREEA